MLPSLSLHTNVVTLGRLVRFLTSLQNFLVSLFLFVSCDSLIFLYIHSFFFLQILLAFILFCWQTSKFVLVFLIRHFLLASLFSWIALFNSLSHQWLAFLTSLDSLNSVTASNITSFRICQSWLIYVSSSISCNLDCKFSWYLLVFSFFIY